MSDFNQNGYMYGSNPNPQGWYYPYNNNSYAPTQRFNTNVILVTGPEEALIKTNTPNSDMVYFDQDKSLFYRVKVDQEGRKTWAQFPYSAPNAAETSPATKADIQQLIARIELLEQAQSRDPKNATRKKKEVTENAESDG